MTQHGSFPGRPRGRRARQDNDVPEWQGFDATPQDQREFPDLAPIRPREARHRDGRAQGEWQGQQGQAAQQDGYGGLPGGGYGGGQHGAGYPGDAGQAAQQAWPEQASPQQASPQQEQGWPGQAPWAAQPAPEQQAAQWQAAQQQATQQSPQWQVTQQQAPPQQAPQQPGRQDEDVPSWAEPDSVEAFSARWHRRGLDSRDDRRAGRRMRRVRHRLLYAAVGVVALVAAVAAYLLIGGPGAANLGFGGIVTSFLPGELQQVPNPCTTVPPATLSQYLPGKLKQAAPPLNSGANTECTWTLDASPLYRVLQVQFTAYSPSALASENGSATFAAEDAYQTFEKSFISPGPKSGQPKAAVTDLSGMPGGGQTSAFQATQVFNRGGATMDVANVMIRYRNVIINVVVDGLDQSGHGKQYGPVSMSDLTAAATTVGKEMAAKIAG